SPNSIQRLSRAECDSQLLSPRAIASRRCKERVKIIAVIPLILWLRLLPSFGGISRLHVAACHHSTSCYPNAPLRMQKLTTTDRCTCKTAYTLLHALGCIKECGQVADYQTGSYLWQHHHVGSSAPSSKLKRSRWSCKTTGPLPKWPTNPRSITASWTIG